MECDILADTETVFMDTVAYKGTRFNEKSILDLKTHFKKTETFQYTHFTSCHQPRVKKKRDLSSLENPTNKLQKLNLRKTFQI